MAWSKDVTGVDEVKRGTYRSLNGAADENIFTGRASKAGFYCFFKVWRDMPYDAVLDYKGVLYRVEIKGSSNNTFSVTRGSRSGKQIIRGRSRTRTLSREDCDFVVGVDSNTGDCYIIPEDVVEILDINSLSHAALINYYEKWKLFMYGDNFLSKEQTRDGIRSMSLTELNALAERLEIVVPTTDIRVHGTKKTISDPKDKTVYSIWEDIAKRL